MARYFLSENDYPLASDYFYEANHSFNDHFPQFPLHMHNYYEIYFFLRGNVKIVISDQVLEVEKGDVIIFPPYQIHGLAPVDLSLSYERMYLWITEYCLSTFQFNEYSLLRPVKEAGKLGHYKFHISDEADYNRMVSSIDRIVEQKVMPDGYEKEFMNQSYILQLITTLNKYIIATLNLDPGREKPPTIIENIIGYINEHFRENITLDKLAEKFYLNKYTISNDFKKYTCITLHHYLIIKRIAEAKRCMSNGMPPSAVYLECGFRDYSNFYRCFVKEEGVTPKQYMDLMKP